MPIDHHEARDCGCVLLHRRVYVCEKHAAMPEKIRDRISEMAAQVMAKEIDAAVVLERERCAKIAHQYADYAKESPASEHGGFKDPLKLVDMAERIEKDIREGR